MSTDLWDLHDVIGAKPAWFYAKCLDDYMMSSYEPPKWIDMEEDLQYVETSASKCDQACQTDFSDGSKDSEQSAEEGKRRRAAPLERTLSIGTTSFHEGICPAIVPCCSLSPN